MNSAKIAPNLPENGSEVKLPYLCAKAATAALKSVTADLSVLLRKISVFENLLFRGNFNKLPNILYGTMSYSESPGAARTPRIQGFREGTILL